MKYRTVMNAFLYLSLFIPLALNAQRLEIDSLLYKDAYRKIRVYIPSSTKKFSGTKIIYMLDAQNLFDPKTSFAGEWEVDESIENLETKNKPIIVGIDHGNENRIDELTPYHNEKYGGGNADEFLKFIIDEVIPFIEAKYTFEHKREDTLIAGSSLGGLFSHYAVITEPKIFSAAGIFSPSYWFSDKIYTITTKAHFDNPTFFYLSGGDSESENLIQEMKRMKMILESKSNVSSSIKIIPDAEHNEKQWRASFPKFLRALNL